MVKEITSLTNATIKAFAALNIKKNRDKARKFLIDGDHLVREAQKKGLLETVLFVDYLPDFLRDFPRLIKVTPAIMKKITNVVDPKNVIGVCSFLPPETTIDSSRIIVLDGVQDPGNGGTILRSALAFGFGGMIMSEDCFDIYNMKFIRATMGAFFALPIVRGDLKEILLRYRKTHRLIAAEITPESIAIDDVKEDGPLLIIVGNEGNGISKDVRNLTDLSVKIPIVPDFDSLNVGVAASIFMARFRNLK